MNPKVDTYLSKADTWQEATKALRKILLDCPLTEELKWGSPCYTFQGSNVVLIHSFKTYCALLFFKGALMKDPHGLLIQQTENVQAARQIRFAHAGEITAREALLKQYVLEAIEVEKAGLKVPYKKTAAYSMPEEFRIRLQEVPGLKTAFEALTPGRQRAYLLYFSSAKQSATRASRVEKLIPRILSGKGLNDR